MWTSVVALFLAGVVRVSMWQAGRLVKAGRVSEAIWWFSVAVPLCGGAEQAQARYRRARAYLDLDLLMAALADLEMVVRLTPSFSPGLQYLAHVQHKLGRCRAAHRSARLLVEVDPLNVAGHRYLESVSQRYGSTPGRVFVLSSAA